MPAAPTTPPREHPISLFAGRANPGIAKAIAAEFGKDLGEVRVYNFSDGEIYVSYEESIRGTDLFIIQSTPPGGDNWIELLLMVDAARRASASRITAVMPYFGYARQERKDRPRVSIAAKLMANLLTTAGVNRVLTMDLHAPQIQGFFDVPVDHLYASVVLTEHFRAMNLDPKKWVIVAPDVGSIKIARAYARRLGLQLAVLDKRRPAQNQAEVVAIIGEVDGCNVLMIDDMIDTAGTLTGGAAALRKEGAREIIAACTHPILSGPAYDRIADSPISRVIVTDTIPLDPPENSSADKFEIVSVAGLFADAIRRIYAEESVSTLFAS